MKAQAAARKRARAEESSTSTSNSSVRPEESHKRARVEGAAAATVDGGSTPTGQSASVLPEATTPNRKEVDEVGTGYGAAVSECRDGGVFVDGGEVTEVIFFNSCLSNCFRVLGGGFFCDFSP